MLKDTLSIMLSADSGIPRILSLAAPLVLRTVHGLARLLPYTVNEVMEGQYGMPMYHPGTGISHHGADLITHHGFVAMDQAPGTLRLPFLVWTVGEPFPGICQKLTAIRAEIIRVMVLRAAMHPDHRFNSLIFSCKARVPASNGRFLALNHTLIFQSGPRST